MTLSDELTVEREKNKTCIRIIAAFVKLYEDIESDTEGRWPNADVGCLECTAGTVPNDRNTGLCAYHLAKTILK